MPVLSAGLPVGQPGRAMPDQHRQGSGWAWLMVIPLLFRKAWFGLLLVVLIVVPLEIAARYSGGEPWWRPATMLGAFYGELQNAYVKGHTEAQVALADQLKLVESQYNERVAQIQAHYQAQLKDYEVRITQKAQEEVAIVQARLEQTTKAYEHAYMRATELAKAGAEVAKAYEQMRVSLADRGAGGQLIVKNVADVMKGVAIFAGSQDLYMRSDMVARAAQQEMAADVRAGIADLHGPRLFSDWNRGLPLPQDLAMEMVRSVPPRYELAPQLPPPPVQPPGVLARPAP